MRQRHARLLALQDMQLWRADWRQADQCTRLRQLGRTRHGVRLPASNLHSDKGPASLGDLPKRVAGQREFHNNSFLRAAQQTNRLR